MFDNPIFPTAEKFVNPATVPTAKVLTIYSDDPRNNEMYKKTCGMTVVVIEKPNIENPNNQIGNSIFESENTEAFAPFDNNVDVVPLPDNNSAIALGIPQNLNIDADNGFAVEFDSKDGSVRFTAILNFDDVVGATKYDYVLVAI